MKKQNVATLIFASIAIVLILTILFFLPRSPLDVRIMRPVCDPAKTDCSKFNPDGTPSVQPPESVSSVTTTQVGQIDEHLFIDNTLKEVNFCGKTYRVKQVMIDGVDVVQRIAELATKNLMPETFKVGPYLPPMDEWIIVSNKNGEIAKIICENVSLNNSYSLSMENPTTIYEISGVDVFTNTHPNTNIKTYSVSAHGLHVVVNPSTNEIFTSSEYDGSSIGPLGTLK